MKRPAVKGADRVDMTTKSGSGPCNRLIKLKSPMIMPNTYLWSPLGSGKRCQVFTQIFKVIWIIFFQLRGKGMKIIGGGKMCCSLELKTTLGFNDLVSFMNHKIFLFFQHSSRLYLSYPGRWWSVHSCPLILFYLLVWTPTPPLMLREWH